MGQQVGAWDGQGRCDKGVDREGWGCGNDVRSERLRGVACLASGVAGK